MECKVNITNDYVDFYVDEKLVTHATRMSQIVLGLTQLRGLVDFKVQDPRSVTQMLAQAQIRHWYIERFEKK